MIAKLQYSVFSLAAFLSACASVDITPIDPSSNHDPKKKGYVFYAPQPYMTVAQAEHGGCALAIVYLPDKSRPYRAEVKGGIGSVAFSPKFANGWMLSEAGVTVDNNGDELLAAIGGLLALDGGGSPPARCEKEGMYRLDIDAEQNFSWAKVF